MNNLPPEKKDKIQISAANVFPFQDMNKRWSPEGDLQFGILKNKIQPLKYVGKGSTDTLITLHTILLGVLNFLKITTLQNPDLNPKWVDSVYTNHSDTIRKAVILPSILPTMCRLWKYRTHIPTKIQIQTERKTEMSIF